jgi:hypothetical protein
VRKKSTRACVSRAARFVEALQNAAYNAPPFPAGQLFSAGIFRDSAMPHVAENSAQRGGIFVTHRKSAATQ